MKKRMQNGKRKRRRKGSAGSEKARKQDRQDTSVVGYDAEMVDHVRMFTNLIEGREVSVEEVIEMLERAEKRQQGIGEDKESEYGVRDPKNDTS